MAAASSSVARSGASSPTRRTTWLPGSPRTWNHRSRGRAIRRLSRSLAASVRPTSTCHPPGSAYPSIPSNATDSSSTGLGVPSRQIEEIHDPRFDGILRADDPQPVVLDDLLQQLGAMSEVVGGRANVGSHRLPHQRRLVVPQLG